MQSEDVIEHTLSLFFELVSGLVVFFLVLLNASIISIRCFNREVDCRYMTGKLLLKFDTVKFILGNHTVRLKNSYSLVILFLR